MGATKKLTTLIPIEILPMVIPTTSTTPFIKCTGKTMVMKKGMCFSPNDWKKVTQAQKTQIYAFRKEKKTKAASTTVAVYSTEIQPAPTPATHSYAAEY
jgi:hypothetical protein